MDVMITTISALVESAPWIAGVFISLIAYRRRKSAALRLDLTAFAGLIALPVIGGNLIMPVTDLLIDVGWNIGTVTRTLDGISMLFQLGRTGLLILLAIVFFRLLQENHAAPAVR